MKNKEINILVGKTLQERRKTMRAKQEDVAKLLGISRVSISNIEQGKHSLTMDNLYRLCQFYGCQPNDILPKVIQVTFTPEMEAAINLLPEDKRFEARYQIKRILTQDSDADEQA